MNITYTTADSTQYENGGIVKAEPGTLYAIMGYNLYNYMILQPLLLKVQHQLL